MIGSGLLLRLKQPENSTPPTAAPPFFIMRLRVGSFVFVHLFAVAVLEIPDRIYDRN
jgi:hypothetical protein